MKKIYPEYWQEASKELSKKDKILRQLIQEYSDTKLYSNLDPLGLYLNLWLVSKSQ